MTPASFAVKDIQDRLNLSRSTVIREISEGRLQAQKVRGQWLITHRDLEAYLGQEKAHELFGASVSVTLADFEGSLEIASIIEDLPLSKQVKVINVAFQLRHLIKSIEDQFDYWESYVCSSQFDPDLGMKARVEAFKMVTKMIREKIVPDIEQKRTELLKQLPRQVREKLLKNLQLRDLRSMGDDRN